MERSYNVLLWLPKKKKNLMGPFKNVGGTFCVCWEVPTFSYYIPFCDTQQHKIQWITV